jgi:hypothetical protein
VQEQHDRELLTRVGARGHVHRDVAPTAERGTHHGQQADAVELEARI